MLQDIYVLVRMNQRSRIDRVSTPDIFIKLLGFGFDSISYMTTLHRHIFLLADSN